jgi:hypothetical protein
MFKTMFTGIVTAAVGVGGVQTAMADHDHHHGHHHHHGGARLSIYGGNPYGYYAPRPYLPPPVVVPVYPPVAPAPYVPAPVYGPAYGPVYGPAYGGGVGFSNRNFSLWLGR